MPQWTAENPLWVVTGFTYVWSMFYFIILWKFQFIFFFLVTFSVLALSFCTARSFIYERKWTKVCDFFNCWWSIGGSSCSEKCILSLWFADFFLSLCYSLFPQFRIELLLSIEIVDLVPRHILAQCMLFSGKRLRISFDPEYWSPC